MGGVAVAAVFAVISAAVASGESGGSTSPESSSDKTGMAVSVPVERREIADTVVTRGQVIVADTLDVKFPEGATTSTSPIVTKVPAPGDREYRAGDVLAEVSGRPVLVLEGSLPAYRDMREGTSGEDVSQLEVNLSAVGLSPGVVDGVFDAATAAAVVRWYERAGYDVRSPTTEEQAAIDRATEQVDEVTRALRTATATLQAKRRPATPSERLGVVFDLAAALDDQRTHTDTAARAVDAATRAKTLASQRLDAARRARDRAAADLASLRAASASSSDIAQATQLLDTAELSLDEMTDAATSADAALGAAASAAAQAQRDDQRAVARSRAAVTDMEAGPDVTPEIDDFRAAMTALSDANTKLAEARAAGGVSVPQSELLFVPTLPRRVTGVHTQRGASASGKLATLGGSNLQVAATVSTADRGIVEVGTAVLIDEASRGIDTTGKIVRIADDEAQAGIPVPAGQFVVLISLDKALELDSSDAVSVRVRIPLRRSSGRVLAVPIAAVQTRADGTAYVQVESPKGSSPRTVVVRAGLTAGGYVEITQSPDITEGTLVVVGRQQER